MADVVPGYVPTNGTVFNPAGWNSNLHSTTDGVSVYGELNGHLQDANFAGGETIKPRHLRPFEGFRASWGGQTDTTDWFEHLYGTEFNNADWLYVPGATRRMYVPYSGRVLFQVSAFGSNMRLRQVETPPAPDDPTPTGPDMYVAMFVGGPDADPQPVGHSLRPLPYTYYPLAATGDPGYFLSKELVLTQHWDLVHLVEDATPGWYDVTMAVNIPQNIGKEVIYALYGGGDTDQLTDHDVVHRIRLGIRAASIIAFPFPSV